MSEAIVGVKSVVWGLACSPAANGMGTALVVQSGDFSVESDKAEFRNAIGQCVAEIYYNQKQTLTLEVVPSADTIANARNSNLLPLPGSIVTVTDTGGVTQATANDYELVSTNSGKYIFDKGTKKKSNTGLTMLTFEMHQYVENDTAVVIV